MELMNEWHLFMEGFIVHLEMMTSLYFPILFVKNLCKFDDLRGGGVKNPNFLMRSFVNDPLPISLFIYTT